MYQYRILATEYTTPTTLLLTLQADEAQPLLTFQPGQYAAINYFRGRRPSAARCFSIASSPTQQGIVQFGIRVKGRFTRTLAQRKVGETVQLRGPFGSFILDSHRYDEVVLCAGGIGVTPFMSMVRFATQAQLTTKISLIISARTQDEVPFAAELARLGEANPNLHIYYSVSEGPVDKLPKHGVYHGRISGDILSDATNGKFTDKAFFICGPAPFMLAVQNLLKSRHVAREHIHTEAFSQGPHPQTGKLRSWPFNIYLVGALGTAAASFIVMAGDLLKTLPSSIMPTTLTDKSSASNNRQQDLDALVNRLAAQTTTTTDSPNVNAANKAVADAQAQIDGQKTSGTGTTAKTTTAAARQTTTTSTTTTTAAPTPTPAPAPVCTTSPSGVTTCR